MSFFYTLLARVVSGLSIIALSFWVSYELGVEESGFINLFWTLLLSLSIISKFGYEYVVLKMIGIYVSIKEFSKAEIFFRNSLTLILLISLAMIILFNIIDSTFGDIIFNKKDYLHIAYQYAIIALLPFSLAIYFSLILKGFKSPAIAYLVDQGGIAFLLFIILYISNSFSLTINIYDDLLPIFLFSSTLILLLSYTIVQKKFILTFNTKVSILLKYDYLKKALVSNFPYFVLTISEFMLYWSPIIIISTLYNLHETGVYSNIMRLSQIIVFVMSILNVLLAPHLAAMINSNQMDKLEQEVLNYARINFLFGLFIMILIIVASPTILDLLNINIYDNIVLITFIYASQFIKILSGPSMYILTMSKNKEHLLIKISSYTLISSIIFFPISSFIFGINGIAVTFFLITLAINLYAIIKVKEYYNISILSYLYKGLKK